MEIDNPYFLLTPGPLSTSATVKKVMLRDWCTWDDDYNGIVESIRRDLVALATDKTEEYTSVLMQGSGTFSVESVIGSAMSAGDKILILDNGAYGRRMVEIAEYLKVDYIALGLSELETLRMEQLVEALDKHADITHVAMVHCETTTGMLNEVMPLCLEAKRRGKTVILDAMSSFGGIQMDVDAWGLDFMISSANKCIQGVPGFGFVIAKRKALEACRGKARSLSLDLFAQWDAMENGSGKWRFTSPTHVVRAFRQAINELEHEGGIALREERYRRNHQALVEGMKALGFRPLLEESLRSPIITSFHYPESSAFEFREFYERLKELGFVIYPGKVSDAETFRIGTIGDVFPADMEKLVWSVGRCMYWEASATAD